MSVNVLPDMDEPRLRALGKQLNRNRKASIISTDKLKEKYDLDVKSLNKAQRNVDVNYHLKSMRLKKNLARVRGTQKVLKAKREQTFWEDSEEYPFGIYEGEKLDSYRREIDNVIEQKHPKYRRMRKVEKQLKTGKISGKLLGDEDAKMQFNMIMSNERKNRYLHRENPLTRTFLHGQRTNRIEEYLNNFCARKTVSDEQDSVEEKSLLTESNLAKHQRNLDFAKNNRIENLKCESRSSRRGAEESKPLSDSGVCSVTSDGDLFVTEPLPSRHLPPITAKKELITKKRSEETSRVVLPDLSIRRVTKGDLSFGNKDSQKFERLKQRRATTVLV